MFAKPLLPRSSKKTLAISVAVAIAVTGLSISPAQAAFLTYSCATGLESAVSPTYRIDTNGAVINGGLCTGEVVILPGPTSIGRFAFQESTLTTIIIPDTVVAIGEAAFNASSIQSINIPVGVTSIGASAFELADRLTSINIPEGLTTIGASAFRSAYYLQSFYFLGDAPLDVGQFAFENAMPQVAYIQPDAKGFQVSDPKEFGYGNSYEQIYWKGLIVRPAARYVSSELFREWKTPLLPTQTGPKVGDTVYASAFERTLDPSLLIDPSLIDDVSFNVIRPEEYVYRITKQENDASSSVDRQSHSSYESLTKAKQDSWYEEMGFDPVDAPDRNPYRFSWRAFICLTAVQDGEVYTVTYSKPTNLAVSHASRDDTTVYMGDQRRNRDFMFRDLTTRPSYASTRTVVGNYGADFYEAGRDYIFRGTSFSLGVTEVTSDCGANGTLEAMTILDASLNPITSKSFVIPKNLKIVWGMGFIDDIGSEGVTIGVTGGGPLFEAALFGLTTIASANPPASGSTSPNRVVTLNANGGSGPETKIVGNAPALLPANTFSRKGYVFSGWNTKAGGSGVAYSDKANFSFNSDLVLYAQWSLASAKKIISNFAGNKSTLTAVMKASISSWARTLPQGGEFICQGSTSGGKVTAFDKKLAANRAKNVCSHAVEVRNDLTYKIRLKPSSSTAVSARHVWMFFN